MAQIKLEKLKVGMSWIASTDIDPRYMEDQIIHHITGYVWSQDAGRKETFKYPADWWQAFKERWLPTWLLRKYPVKYTVREFTVKATYPELKIQNHEPVMRLFVREFDED